MLEFILTISFDNKASLCLTNDSKQVYHEPKLIIVTKHNSDQRVNSKEDFVRHIHYIFCLLKFKIDCEEDSMYDT